MTIILSFFEGRPEMRVSGYPRGQCCVRSSGTALALPGPTRSEVSCMRRIVLPHFEDSKSLGGRFGPNAGAPDGCSPWKRPAKGKCLTPCET